MSDGKSVKPVFLIQIPAPFYNTLEKNGELSILQQKVDELKAGGWIAFIWCTKEVEKTSFSAYGIDVAIDYKEIEDLVEMASHAISFDELKEESTTEESDEE